MALASLTDEIDPYTPRLSTEFFQKLVTEQMGNMHEGDRLIIEKHAPRNPGDALWTVTIKEFR